MNKKIKFSKGTLRKNPEMVKCFYEKKINELSLKLELLTQEKWVIEVGLNGKTLNDIERLIMDSKYIAREYTIKLEYNYEELLNIVSKIEKKEEKLVETNKYLNELRDEYSGLLQKIKSS